MKEILIFGSGGHAKVIYSEIIKNKKLKFLGFVDEKKKRGEIIINQKKKYYNLGKISEVIKKNNNFRGIIGIGLNFMRKKVYEDIILLNKNFKFEKIVSQDAIINSNVTIGDGTFIVSGSVINIGTNIGTHCVINTACAIDHDNLFENFSSTGPGVRTGGNVVVRKNSYIGINSSVKQGVEIQNDTVVGAQSYVNKDCEKESVYYGSPAKKIRNRTKGENYL
jgi:sugar O-acyltransferase (sialic acid O-acetyltransferase NeuD family)